MTLQRIQRKRTKGFKLPENTVCVDRNTKWGNPFYEAPYGLCIAFKGCYPIIVNKHPLYSAVKMFHECVLNNTVVYQLAGTLGYNKGIADLLFNKFQYISQHVLELKGKNLACFCKEGADCHGDVLLELANK